MSKSVFTGMILSSMGGAALLLASAASAQSAPGGAPVGANPGGGPRPQDIAASNRQVDNDYNVLASRGVKVTDKSRDNSGTGSAKKRASMVPASAADIQAGAQVRDIKGVPVGTIATLAPNEVVTDTNQAVIDTGETKIGVPLNAFGKDDQGLLLSITADTFKKLVAQAHGQSEAKPSQSS